MRPSYLRARAPLVAAVAALVLLLIGSGIPGGGPRNSPSPQTLTVGARSLGQAPETPTGHGVAASSPVVSWAGSTVRTLLPNYNASLPGNFLSSVDDWEVGTPAFVPTTGTVWWPTLPVSVGGSPAPAYGPALLYNVSTAAFVGIDRSVTNASAFTFDPVRGMLYAADPLNDSVEEVNVTTGVPTGVVYAVGSDPVAIIFDNLTDYLFVADAASNAVTVINPAVSGGGIVALSIPAGKDPFQIADDPYDHWVYIADGGAAQVSRLNTTNLSQPRLSTGIYYGIPSGVAVSPTTHFVAVTTSSSGNMTILSGQTGAVVRAPIVVGTGWSKVSPNWNGSEFLVANSSGSSVGGLAAATPFTVASGVVHVGRNPTQLIALPSQNGALVWANGSRTASVVPSNLTGTPVSAPGLGVAPASLVYDQPTGRVVVFANGNETITEIDPYTGDTAAAEIHLAAPFSDVVPTATGSVIYLSEAGYLQEYDTSSEQLLAQNSSPGTQFGPLVLDPSDGLLWVSEPAHNRVSAFRASSLDGTSLTFHVTLNGTDPWSLAYDGGTDSILALNSSTLAIEQFSASDGSPMGEVAPPVGNASSIVYDPGDGLAYVAGAGLGALDPATMAIAGTPVALPAHRSVGGLAYDASRGALFVATGRPGGAAGAVTAIDATRAPNSGTPSTTIATGFMPGGLLALEPSTSLGLNGTGVLLSANTVSGTVGVIATPPQVVSATFAPPTVDANVTTELVVATAGGAASVAISYAGLPRGCHSAVTVRLSCTPKTAGSYAVLIALVDELGQVAYANASLQVDSTILLQSTVGVSGRGEGDVGVPVTLTASARGGTPPYRFSWNLGDGSLATGKDTNHTYGAPGHFVVGVTVTDHGGGIFTNETVLAVATAPAARIDVLPSAVTDVDLELSLQANVTGGSAPGTSQWDLGDGTHATGASLTHAWGSAALYLVDYRFTDSVGVQAVANASVLVNPALQGSFSVSPAISTPAVGTKVRFESNLTGGTGPVDVTWDFGDGSIASGRNVTHAYATGGNYTVSVSATDAAGAVIGSTFPGLAIASKAAPPTPLFGGGFGASFVVGLLVGGTVAAVALFFAERSRRGRRPGPPSAYVPPPAPRRGRT